MLHRIPRKPFRGAALALGFAASAGLAFAQYPVTVTGGGYARGCYEAVKGNFVSAVKSLEICDIALSQEKISRTNRAATYINRGILHMREQRHERAMKDYEAAIKLSPGMPEAKINLGALYYYLGRYADAVAALDEGVKVKDDTARTAAFYNRALAHERLGNLEAAYADYRRALAVDPAFEPAARQLKRYSVLPAAG